MAERYQIAIIGSGPGGMSAAARAGQRGASHILLEKTDHLSDTIYKYQRGKHIMATPETLELRSDVDFHAGIREDILGIWDTQTDGSGANVRFNAEVAKVEGEKGNFQVHLAGGEIIEAETVVLAMGLQGNLNKLRCPGAEYDWVQYQVDDPWAYDDEDIVVVGVGDAGLENALGLAEQNRVTIINGNDGFERAKAGNRSLILKAIEAGDVTHLTNCDTRNLAFEPGKGIIPTQDGITEVKCDRVVARIGASPPRAFLEAIGIEFASKERAAVPPLSTEFESNVPGIFVIGALAGYPLIKHCMNQGYDVVENILGHPNRPVDEPLLAANFETLQPSMEVDEALAFFKVRIPLFEELTMLQMREFMLDSKVHALETGETVFDRDDFGDSLLCIADGSVKIEVVADNPDITVELEHGDFFGEVGLISGRRRAATVKASSKTILVEIPRNSAIKLMRSFPGAKRVIDDTVLYRQLVGILGSDLSRDDLADVIETAELKQFASGDTLIREGESDDAVYVIQRGSVTVSRNIGGRDVVLFYVPAGHYVGEMALFRDGVRSATVEAAIKTDAIVIHGEAFRALAEKNPRLREEIESSITGRTMQNVAREDAGQHASTIVDFLINQGLGEATDVLLIDESLCVGCDNCEKACAATHNGVSRLNREAGPTYASIHVPTSCRHCEHPHCMADCPPDAIQRAPNGEVFIQDTCIGCGNCKEYCPYGVIQLSQIPPKRPGLLNWLLFGAGAAEGGTMKYSGGKSGTEYSKDGGAKLAVKCDMCKGIEGGAACVRACPTGAAIRVSPEDFLNVVHQG